MTEQEEAIFASPKFNSLVKQRSRFMHILLSLMLCIFFTFSLTVAFAPELLGTVLWPGSHITIGIPIGIAVVLSSLLLIAIYVYRANTEFDRLTKEILDEAERNVV